MPSHYGKMKHGGMKKKNKVAEGRKAIIKNLMKKGTSEKKAMAVAKKFIKG